MLNKIHVEMSDFSHNIKTIKSHEELLTYMNSNFYASIKLLVFASGTFTLYSRIMLFIIIALMGLLISSTIGEFGEHLKTVLNTSYILAITLCLFFILSTYIMYCKKFLILNIEKSKIIMEKSENSGN